MSKHITFYNFLLTEKSKEYNVELPLGGISKNAPIEIKEQYKDFVLEYEALISKLISEGETAENAKQYVEEYFLWNKKEMIRN